MNENNISSVLIKENDEHIEIVTKTCLSRKVLGRGLDPKTTSLKDLVAFFANPRLR